MSKTATRMDNIHTTFTPFYCVLKLLGIFPISYQGSFRKGVMEQKFLDVLFSIIFFLVCLFLFLINFSRSEKVCSSSDILGRAWDWSLQICLSLLLISLCYQLVKRKSIVNFLGLIEEFDLKVSYQLSFLLYFS